MFVYGSVAGYRFQPTFVDKVRQTYNVYQGERSQQGFAKGGRSTRYGQQLVSDVKSILDFYSDYNSNFELLRSSARELIKNNGGSTFEKRAVEVADPNILKAAASPGSLVKIYDVSVNELSTARQEKTGFFEKNSAVVDTLLDREGNKLLQEGQYNFSITQNGITENFTVELKDNGDGKTTFSDLFTEIAQTINNSSLGVRASFGRESGRSSELVFSLTATEKGTDSDFIFQDVKAVSGPGLLESLGFIVTQKARDASVSIEGVEHYNHYSSGDNVYILKDYGVELNLSEAGQTYFMVTKDIKDVRDTIEKFTHDYGNALIFMRQTDTNGEMEKLTERLMNIAKEESDNLKAIGITVSEDGRLLLEKGLFDGVLEEMLAKNFDMVEEILGGLHGIASGIVSFSDQALEMSPLRFMNQPPEFNLLDFVRDSYDTMGRVMFQGTGHQGKLLDMMI